MPSKSDEIAVELYFLSKYIDGFTEDKISDEIKDELLSRISSIEEMNDYEDKHNNVFSGMNELYRDYIISPIYQDKEKSMSQFIEKLSLLLNENVKYHFANIDLEMIGYYLDKNFNN